MNLVFSIDRQNILIISQMIGCKCVLLDFALSEHTVSSEPVRLWVISFYSSEFSDCLDTKGWDCAGDSEHIVSVRLPAI